jgi:hypothetical protein
VNDWGEAATTHKSRDYGDLTGQRFGRLTVARLGDRRRKQRRWICSCDCGADTIVPTDHLRSGHTTSCGCLRQETMAAGRPTHGLAKHPLYRVWGAMKDRCTNPNAGAYPWYGGRGVRVCGRWQKDFAAFLADMGPRPTPGHSIDRIDRNGDYCPENCRWATRTEQARNHGNNRLLTLEGRTKPLVAWAEECGVNPSTVQTRLARGWTVGQALGKERRP